MLLFFLGFSVLFGYRCLDFLLLCDNVLVNQQVLVILVQPGSDLAPCAGGVGIFQPCDPWPCVLLSDNLNDLCVLKRLSQRDDVAVGLCAYRVVSDLGMDHVGKVQCSRSYGKLDSLSLGCEHVDGILEKLALYLVHEGFALLDLGVPALELGCDSGKLLAVHVDPALAACLGSAFGFVDPVGCDSEFGNLVHLVGADLDFKDDSVHAHDSCVEALVVVGLGHGDVVLEPAFHGWPEVMDYSHQRVALGDCVADDPDSEDVEDLIQFLAALLHLHVDGVGVLLT